MSNLVSYFFQTKAMKICPDNKPFWYTSGKIGPYFINAHFLYGSEQDANSLLSLIDSKKENHLDLPKEVFHDVLAHYETNEIYKSVINDMIDCIKTNIDVSEIDYISGGERRDWFFSNIIAYLLQKPHITIYKDLNTVTNNFDFSETLNNSDVSGHKVLHIADLITEASSYTRAWIPAIDSLGAKINWSLALVDRKQGGTGKLMENNIKPYALLNVDETLFEKALSLNIINESQLDMLKGFYSDPDKTMKDFITAHPDFIENSLHADEKTAARAKLCLEQKFYQ